MTARDACNGLSILSSEFLIRDATTQLPVSNLVGTATDGSESFALTASGILLYGPENRFAVYTVVISAPGYVTWMQRGIDTTRLQNGCPATLGMTVDLTRA